MTEEKLPHNSPEKSSPDKETPQPNKVGHFANKIRTAALIIIFAALAKEMKSQTNQSFAEGKYNTIKTIVDYNGAASAIAAQIQAQVEATEQIWNQSIETRCLNPQTTVNGNANVPSSVLVANNLSSTATNYDAWVKNYGIYSNGRPNADTTIGYVYQLQVNTGMTIGYTYGGGTGYSTAAHSLATLNSSGVFNFINTHEVDGHGLGLGHSDATTFTMKVDLLQNGNYIYNEPSKTVMSAGGVAGPYTLTATSSAANNASVLNDGYIYTTKGGYPARVLATDLDITGQSGTSGNNSLDKLHDRLKIGGVIHKRVHEETVPANQKIENKTPQYTINGNTLTITNIAEFDTLRNPNNNILEDCQVFVYDTANTATGSQIARYSGRSMIGFRWDTNGTIDFSDFLLAHPGKTLADYSFRILAINQNQMSPVAVPFIDTIPPVAVGKNIFAYVDANGTLTVDPLLVDNGSTDNDTIVSMSLNPNTFNCSQNGPNTVSFIVYDAAGNSDTASVIIPVQDTIAPTFNATQNMTFYIDANGSYVIDPANGITGLNDNCDSSPTLSANPANLNCNDLGYNNYTATATDNSGNSRNVNIAYNLVDTISPTAIAKDTIISINDGPVTLDPQNIVNATDNCGIAGKSLSQDYFDTKGVYNVTASGTDQSGNTGTDHFTVTVNNTIGIEEPKISDFKMYPNPFENYLQISNLKQESELQIFTISGKLLRQEILPEGDNVLDVSALKSGMYLFVLKNKDETITVKMVK